MQSATAVSILAHSRGSKLYRGSVNRATKVCFHEVHARFGPAARGRRARDAVVVVWNSVCGIVFVCACVAHVNGKSPERHVAFWKFRRHTRRAARLQVVAENVMRKLQACVLRICLAYLLAHPGKCEC